MLFTLIDKLRMSLVHVTSASLREPQPTRYKNCAACVRPLALCRVLSDVLLQPVLDASTDNVMAVLCAFNKADPSDGRDIFFEPSFTASDW